MTDAFNYVAVLVSIVVGLTVTRVLSGLSEMIQAANRPRIYRVHVLWHITLLFNVMLGWWLLYRWRATVDRTFLLFLWITIAPTLQYLGAAILVPGELETTGSPDWRDYYFKNRRGFFFAFGSIAPLDIIDTLFKGWPHFLAQGTFVSCFHRLLGDRLLHRRHQQQRALPQDLGHPFHECSGYFHNY
jgi:hypothetical protein